MKVRIEYDGLVIRCATQDEAHQIFAENSSLEPSHDARCLIWETRGDQDYVVTHAVGWEKDLETDRDPSRLAGFPPGSDPARLLA